MEEAAIEFKKAEDTLFTHLSLLLKMKNFSYNIIGCSKFLMMIPRKSEKVMNEIGVNAIIFMGSMLIKDSKLFDQVEHLWKPSNILRELTFTEIPKWVKNCDYFYSIDNNQLISWALFFKIS